MDRGAQLLLTAEERVDRALTALTAGNAFTPQQNQWLDRIRRHLVENLTVGADDFDVLPVFADFGGWTKANSDFGGKLAHLLTDVNAAVAA